VTGGNRAAQEGHENAMSARGKATELSPAIIAERHDPGSPLFSSQRTMWLTLLLLVAVTLLAVL